MSFLRPVGFLSLGSSAGQLYLCRKPDKVTYRLPIITAHGGQPLSALPVEQDLRDHLPLSTLWKSATRQIASDQRNQLRPPNSQPELNLQRAAKR